MTNAELKRKTIEAEARAELADQITGEVAKLAWSDKIRYTHKIGLLKLTIVCLAISFTIVGLFAVQRTFDYVTGLTITTTTETFETTADSGEGGTANAINGDGNSVSVGGGE